MKLILILLAIIQTTPDAKLARIVDKDGFADVRAGQGLTFAIVDKIITSEFFYCETANNSDWYKVTLLRWFSREPISGYVHKSRIQIIEDLDDREQKKVILSVLRKQRQLASRLVDIHTKYDTTLKKWKTAADSTSYRLAGVEHGKHSDNTYSPVLQLLPKLFCRTTDGEIIGSFFSTIWSDKLSANESPSMALGECFACGAHLLIGQVNKLKTQEQRELIIDDIEWGLLNKFNVSENEGSTDPNFLQLKKQLDLLREKKP